MDQVKIIGEVDDTTYLLDGLLLNNEYAIYFKTNNQGTSFFYSKVQFNEKMNAYEIISSGVIDENTNISDPFEVLNELRKAFNEITLFTLITQLDYSSEVSLGLNGEGGTKVKEWKHDQ